MRLFLPALLTCALLIYNCGTPMAQTLLRVASISAPGGPTGVAISGSTAYVVTAADNTILAYDVSNPAAPVLLSSTKNQSTRARAIAIVDKKAYVTGYAIGGPSTSQIQVFDVSTPATPVATGGVNAAGPPVYVSASSSRVCITYAQKASLEVYDSQLKLLGTVATSSGAEGITVNGTTAYLQRIGGVDVYDLSTPSNPVRISTFSGNIGAVSGSLAFGAGGGLRVYDISNPQAPILRGSIATDGGTLLAVSGTTAFTVGLYSPIGGSPSVLQAFDVSVPTMPTLLASGGAPATALASSGNTAYSVNIDQNKLDVYTLTCPVATLVYNATSYCQTENTSPTPILTGPAGGSFTAPTGLSINATTGVINLAASTPGTYTITYRGGTTTCPSVATAQVTITAAPRATFTYAAQAYCTNSNSIVTPVFDGNATAGSFSASPTGLSLNTNTGVIALANSQPGTYSVTNTIAASGGCAVASATTQVVVNAAPVATITTSGPTTFCQGGAVTLTASGGASYQWSNGATTPSITVSTSGSYSVVATNAAGCSAASATTVVVNALPPTPTLTIQHNGTVATLTSSAANGNQFYLNGAAIAGATMQTYVVSNPAQLGSYTVVVTNSNGCASMPSAPVIVTSRQKPLAGTSLSVYPTPTSNGVLYVELTGYRHATELTLVNGLGQVVYIMTVQGAAKSITQTIDVRQLARGMYTLQVKTKGGLDTRRIVKE